VEGGGLTTRWEQKQDEVSEGEVEEASVKERRRKLQ